MTISSSNAARHAPEGALLDDLLRSIVASHPDAPALGSRDTAIDFATLDARVRRIANGLAASGATGDRIAIVGRNSEEQVELLLGVVRAGQVALPVNWRLAAREIEYILAHSGAARVFVDREFADVVTQALKARPVPLIVLDNQGATGFAAWRDSQPDTLVARQGTAEDVVLQMYTSGTTGLPKGVMLTNASVMASMDMFSRPPLDLYPSDVIYAPAPMFHITGIGPVLRSVQSGARLVVAHHFVPDEAVRVMAREGVTYTTLAPAMIQACLAAPSFDEAALSTMRIIAYGGSPIAESVLREAATRIGCAFAQCYGLTETTGPITLLTPEDHAPGEQKLLSCGRAVDGIEIAVVDPDGVPLQPGETGEIVVRGDIVMAGYAADPDATTQTIRDGWLRTGDAGYLDEAGYLFIRDRVKDMIVSGGENVYPVEVENALLEHPAIADAAVIGIPDARWGEAALAMIVPAAGQSLDAEGVIAFCHERIAGYKCPKQVRFIDTVPRNAAGKILRRDLRAPFWAGRERLVG